MIWEILKLTTWAEGTRESRPKLDHTYIGFYYFIYNFLKIFRVYICFQVIAPYFSYSYSYLLFQIFFELHLFRNKKINIYTKGQIGRMNSHNNRIFEHKKKFNQTQRKCKLELFVLHTNHNETLLVEKQSIDF